LEVPVADSGYEPGAVPYCTMGAFVELAIHITTICKHRQHVLLCQHMQEIGCVACLRRVLHERDVDLHGRGRVRLQSNMHNSNRDRLTHFVAN
jgi:hypothetical protein